MTQQPASQKNSSSSSFLSSPKFLLPALALLVLVILGVAGLAGFWLWDQTRPVSSISVTGTAKTKVKPNQAEITFYYSESGNDVNKLNQSVDQVTNKIKEALKRNGIEGADLVTNKNAYPDYSVVLPTVVDRAGLPVKPSDNPPTKVEASFQIIFKKLQEDTTKPNKVLQEMTNLGVNRFDPLRYEIGDRTKVCNELQTKAIEDAYRRGGEQIQALGGGRIVRRQLQTGQDCDNIFPPYYAMGREAMTTGAPDSSEQNTPPEVNAGEQELTSQVSVTLDYK
jgi:uncharacterized protein YggE